MGVPARTIAAHLATKRHQYHPHACPASLREAICVEAQRTFPLDPGYEPFALPPTGTPAIPELPVYRGFRCPEKDCVYIARQPKSVRRHCHDQKHAPPPRPGDADGGGPRRPTIPSTDYPWRIVNVSLCRAPRVVSS